MHCRDCFERIRFQALEVAGIEDDVAQCEARAQIKGGAPGGGGGGTGDPMAAMDRAIDLSTELDMLKAKLNRRIEAATQILYGQDGRGGLAKAKGTTTADILCRYYLQGGAWDEIASEVADPESKAPKKWCQMRARRALDYMEREGGRSISKL